MRMLGNQKKIFVIYFQMRLVNHHVYYFSMKLTQLLLPEQKVKIQEVE